MSDTGKKRKKFHCFSSSINSTSICSNWFTCRWHCNDSFSRHHHHQYSSFFSRFVWRKISSVHSCFICLCFSLHVKKTKKTSTTSTTTTTMEKALLFRVRFFASLCVDVRARVCVYVRMRTRAQAHKQPSCFSTVVSWWLFSSLPSTPFFPFFHSLSFLLAHTSNTNCNASRIGSVVLLALFLANARALSPHNTHTHTHFAAVCNHYSPSSHTQLRRTHSRAEQSFLYIRPPQRMRASCLKKKRDEKAKTYTSIYTSCACVFSRCRFFVLARQRQRENDTHTHTHTPSLTASLGHISLSLSLFLYVSV